MLQLKNSLETKEDIIEFGYELVEKRIENLGVEREIPFDINRIKFIKEAFIPEGGYSIEEDLIIIPLQQEKNIGVIIHELIHAFSSGKRNISGLNNYGAFSKCIVLNEAMTELITRNILKENGIDSKFENANKEDISKFTKILVENTKKKIDSIQNNFLRDLEKTRLNRQKHLSQYIKEIKEFIKGFSLITNISEIIESEKYFMQKYEELIGGNIDILIKNQLLTLDIHISGLSIQTKEDIAYKEEVFLLEKIIYKFAEFYKKEPYIIFEELQKDYFNGNYNNFVIKLKDVFGEFDEKKLINNYEYKPTLYDIKKILGIK